MTLEQEIISSFSENTISKLDLLSIFGNTQLLGKIVKVLAEPFRNQVDYVASPEATGWILGAMVAAELGVDFIGIRKEGKSPYTRDRVIVQNYVDYSKTQKGVELRKDAIPSKSKILFVDDWIETGETTNACLRLIEKLGSIPVGIATLNIEKKAPSQEWIKKSVVLRQVGVTITLPTN